MGMFVKTPAKVSGVPSARVAVYHKDVDYRFNLVSGGSEAVSYLGKNKQGMYQFLFSDGSVWTGYVAPVTAE